MRNADWRILVTPTKPTPPAGFRYALDNGAWRAHQQKEPFQELAFLRLLERHGTGADFVIIPDIVASPESLAFSLSWIPRLAHFPQLLLPVQDGMTTAEIRQVLSDNPRIGIFLGGSTEWKLQTMYQWGELAANLSRWYHVGRVNTARRVRLAHEAGALSIDGTSASRYAQSLPLIDTAARQPSLFSPTRQPPA